MEAEDAEPALPLAPSSGTPLASPGPWTFRQKFLDGLVSVLDLDVVSVAPLILSVAVVIDLATQIQPKSALVTPEVPDNVRHRTPPMPIPGI